MVKFVLLDLDDTILDFHKAEAIALRGTFQELGLRSTDEIVARYSEINSRQWQLLEQGRLTRDEILTRRFTLLFREFGIDCSGEKAQAIYERRLGIGHYFMPGAEALLDALYGKYEMYVISNGTAAVQDSRIESAGISRYFGEIFVSQRLGHDKPAREFFDACFARIPGFDREKAVIIGDSLTSDIQGGINAGIRTVWYNYRHKPADADIVPDYETDSLYSIPPLLERI